MTLHLEGGSVEDQLADRLHRLATGRLDLWQLTPSLAGFYTLGHEHGRQSLAQRLEQAEDEAARWYEIANNPGLEYRAHVLRRLDAAAEAAPLHDTDAAFYEHLLEAATTPGRRATAA